MEHWEIEVLRPATQDAGALKALEWYWLRRHQPPPSKVASLMQQDIAGQRKSLARTEGLKADEATRKLERLKRVVSPAVLSHHFRQEGTFMVSFSCLRLTMCWCCWFLLLLISWRILFEMCTKPVDFSNEFSDPIASCQRCCSHKSMFLDSFFVEWLELPKPVQSKCGNKFNTLMGANNVWVWVLVGFILHAEGDLEAVGIFRKLSNHVRSLEGSSCWKHAAQDFDRWMVFLFEFVAFVFLKWFNSICSTHTTVCALNGSGHASLTWLSHMTHSKAVEKTHEQIVGRQYCPASVRRSAFRHELSVSSAYCNHRWVSCATSIRSPKFCCFQNLINAAS